MNHDVDVICFSHLRWDFVYQRPQHLMSRCAKQHRVFFVEEPVEETQSDYLEVRQTPEGVRVIVPHLVERLSGPAAESIQERLLTSLFSERGIEDYVLWYYTPMALGFTRSLQPLATVYDCMDELSGFVGAPPSLLERESELLARADLVFTGGQSLYEAKRQRHPQVDAFPSSIDVAHFNQARQGPPEPADQVAIPHPRIGYYGVIDERLDTDLVAEIAADRPDWQIVLIGPVVKISPATLPQAPNIHYLGMKPYAELPSYVASWDVAIMPFARNAATRYISPTKTLEYLAAGRPVVSTAIEDVVHPYGQAGLVRIANSPAGFVASIGSALQTQPPDWLGQVDEMLAQTSWDLTWDRMVHRIDEVLAERGSPSYETHQDPPHRESSAQRPSPLQIEQTASRRSA